MKSIIKKNRIKQWILVLLLTVANLYAISQNYIGTHTILKFDPSHSVLKPDAPPLQESLTMEQGKTSEPFLSGVGGVSFDQVASPESGLKISAVKMNYNSAAENGHRLELMINNKTVKVNLPDWMLIPIAKYAESSYYSCVTIFGKLKDTTLEKQVTAHNGRVINYHPSFDNTLIGLRLAYMDMLMGYHFTIDLPRDSIGQYVLGKGENVPDTNLNRRGAWDLSQQFAKTENKYMVRFRSYIISDYSRNITFNLLADSLVVTGYPYFYCWKFNSDFRDYDINVKANEVTSTCTQKIKELSTFSGSDAAKNWIIDKVISLSKKYDGKYNFYTDGTFIDVIKLKTDAEKKEYLEKFATQSLFEIIVETEAYMDRDSIIYLKEFSDDVSAKPELFQASNPAVWNATVNTMRYAAFFRYIKANYPETWFAFIKQIKTVKPEPDVITPTIMYDPDSKAMDEAIKKSKTK